MDDATLETLAQLSYIKINQGEKESLKNDLSKILSYVEQLKEVDVEGVQPCNHVIQGIINVMREDEIGTTMSREAFLDNAPDTVGDMIRVPPIIRGGAR